MTRLEIFTKLQELETTKAELSNLLHDAADYYCNGVAIHAVLDTNMFEDKKKYFGRSIKVNKDRFTDYLMEEIKGVDDEINSLIGKLGGAK